MSRVHVDGRWRWPHVCMVCGAEFLSRYEKTKTCSRACTNTFRAGPLLARMARRSVAVESGCLLWIGSKHRDGYGFISAKRGGAELVHRVAWRLAHGPIPAGLYVCHKCDVPACFNVEHLFLGTQSDNMIDMVRKGRWAGKSKAARDV